MDDAPDAPIAEFTGERFIRSGVEDEIELEHLHRYLAASALCRGKRVLDAASGEGYGAAILAEAGATVTGVEIDRDTVAAARRRYAAVEFVEADIVALPFEDHQFDVVTSFETVEHVPNPEAMLDEFRRVLRPDGVLIVSTPDKSIYNQFLAEPNRFHVRELERDEFRDALRRRFKSVEFYGQRVVFGSLLAAAAGGPLESARRQQDGRIDRADAFERAMYLVAVCSDAEAPALPQGVYEGGVPQNALSSILGGVAARDDEIRRLRAEAADSLALPAKDQSELAAEHAKVLEIASRVTVSLNQLRVDHHTISLDHARHLEDAEARRRKSDLRIQRLLGVVNAAEDHASTVERELDRFLAEVDQRLAQVADVEEMGVRHAGAPPPSLRARHMALAGDLLFSLRRMGSGPRTAVKAFLSLRAIRASGLFWPDYYTRGRDDLGGVDLVRHYFLWGRGEGREPSPLFSTTGYARLHPQVVDLGYEPLAHFVRHGRRQGWTAVPVGSASTGIAERWSKMVRERRRGGPAAGSIPAALAGLSAAWRLAEDPTADMAQLALYDVRPDDVVMLEARRGDGFLNRHRLLSEKPDFKAAVDALNSRRATTVTRDDAAAPTASIVVPVHGQLAYTLNCLDALLAHRSRHRFEVIVIDDASEDSTGLHLPSLRGVLYRRQAENAGFLRSSNAGADLSRGRILVMLNNDTRVVDGWLDELVDALDAHPRRGLVGSKLFYPDGTLQEAGGIIWRDGSAWNYGRGDDPNRPEYCYARQVDYVSGASIALPAPLWRQLSGFDEHFAPAYCEDSDLAFRVRAAGFETWLQPLSRVLHYEGKTSGTDETKGVKAYQARNTTKLFERWSGVLGSHRKGGEQPALEKDRNVERRVLVIDATAPTPDQDAGSVTTVKVINVFQALGFKVTYVPIDNFLYQPRYVADLQRMGVECLYAPFQVSLEDYLREHGDLFEVVHIFRHAVMAACIATVRRHCPDAMVMFNNMDLHYLRDQRQAEIEGRTEHLPQILEMKAAELKTLRAADVIFVPSTYEQQVLAEEGLGKPVEVMPYMVDAAEPVQVAEDAQDVVFLGGFNHTPNVDAVEWFAAEIWPHIAEACPKARFVIAGSNPPQSFECLKSERIVVLGRVDDLRPLFEAARVFVAPLRFGAGVKGKIYTAMAFGAPVVSTAIGVEGMGLDPEAFALVADAPRAFAEAVIRVFGERDLEQRLRAAGPRVITRYATLAAGMRVMQQALDQRL